MSVVLFLTTLSIFAAPAQDFPELDSEVEVTGGKFDADFYEVTLAELISNPAEANTVTALKYFNPYSNFHPSLTQLSVDYFAQPILSDADNDTEPYEELSPFPFDPEPPQSELTVEEGAAPEYLNPDPNPLLLPTQPEEVDIIGSQPITLEQAIELAYRNNENLQVALLQLEQSRSALREAEADLFPVVRSSFNLAIRESATPSITAPGLTFLNRQGGESLGPGLGPGSKQKRDRPTSVGPMSQPTAFFGYLRHPSRSRRVLAIVP